VDPLIHSRIYQSGLIRIGEYSRYVLQPGIVCAVDADTVDRIISVLLVQDRPERCVSILVFHSTL
jgi:hypothetical protein